MATLDLTVDLIIQLSSLSIELNDPNARQKALHLSKQLTRSLEIPENLAVDLAFSPFLPTAARIAIDLGLFEHIANNDGPITSSELASLSGGEELLIIRILRPMAAIGFVEEVAVRTWVDTPITRAMAVEGIAAGHRMVGEMVVGAAMKGPKYLKESGYSCPTDPHDGFMQYAFQTKLTSFEYFSSIPEVFRDFNSFMGNTMGARNYWVDWFPVQERLLDGAKKSLPLLVDVGAGKGHDLLAFHNKYPHEGRLVLQDLSPVISSVQKLDPTIEIMDYDFFTEQPVKGARAYFYHHILHDWSDEFCLRILAQVTKAMKPGYSRLLLHEMIIPEQNASAFHCMLDLTMMCFNAGMERTETQWQVLLEKAGLQVVRFWSPPENDADGIVEAMLKE